MSNLYIYHVYLDDENLEALSTLENPLTIATDYILLARSEAAAREEIDDPDAIVDKIGVVTADVAKNWKAGVVLVANEW